MSVDVEVSTGAIHDDILSAEEEVTQALRLFADWIYSRLESEYDYRMSDENVDESIKCNEYEFTEDGSMF